MGFAGWQLLVGRTNHLERRGESRHPAKELPDRWNHFAASGQTPLSEVQLQQWCLYPLWWELSKHLCSLAIFLVGPTELAGIRSFQYLFVLHLFHNKLNKTIDGLVRVVG